VTMHRRPLGWGRTLAAVGAVMILAGCVLPWWQLAQPGGGLPALLTGILTLLLVALPYAVGDRPTAVDRWEAFALLAVIGWVGVAWRIVELVGLGAFRFSEPIQVFTNGPGLWLTGIGLVILSRAAFVMTREPHYR
jgi:multisubunit Na+/H+ antiporter MnhB subunit